MSFSAYRTYQQDPEEYYMRYLANVRPPQPPSGKAANVGTVFDVLVKRQLAHDLGMPQPPEDLARVEWPEAHDVGAWVLAQYQELGAYAALLHTLERSTRIAFEAKLENDFHGLQLKGYPDLTFLYEGSPVVLDWKVRNSVSRWPASPTPGYILCRPKGNAHKLCKTMWVLPLAQHCEGDLTYNAAPFESFGELYAQQCQIGGWLTGTPAPLCWIEELCCKPDPDTPGRPIVRVATHRGGNSHGWADALHADMLRVARLNWYDDRLERRASALATTPDVLELCR
jgi:hypothetical protein